MRRKVKNPKKKDSSRKMTSVEKIQGVIDQAVLLSDNFFLIIFDSLSMNFRLKRQDMTHWQTIVSLSALRGEEEIRISRKPATKILKLLKELSYPFFFIDFENLHSRTRYDFVRVLEPEALAITDRILETMSDVETVQWWMAIMSPASPPGGGILKPGDGLIQ